MKIWEHAKVLVDYVVCQYLTLSPCIDEEIEKIAFKNMSYLFALDLYESAEKNGMGHLYGDKLEFLEYILKEAC